MAIYKVKYGQSIYDIATEKYGNASGIDNIFRDNPTIDFNTYLEEGQEIIISSSANDIANQSIKKYFSNKTITNTDSKMITTILVGEFIYGTILTRNGDDGKYIDEVMWSTYGQLKLNNRVEGGLRNFDRVLFDKEMDLNSDGSAIEMTLNYESISAEFDKWVPLGNITAQSESIVIFDDGNISLNDDFGNQLVVTTTPSQPNVDVSIKVRCEILQTSPLEKNYYLEVDGIEYSALNVGKSKVSVNLLGGSSLGSVGGYNGIVKYFRHNTSEFRFSEGLGNYIHKNTI
jgi:hypothetical protein